MSDRNRPTRINRGDPIPAAWLQKVADNIVQRITVTGGRVRRIGTSLAIDVDKKVAGGIAGSAHFYVLTESSNYVTGHKVVRWNSETGLPDVLSDETFWIAKPPSIRGQLLGSYVGSVIVAARGVSGGTGVWVDDYQLVWQEIGGSGISCEKAADRTKPFPVYVELGAGEHSGQSGSATEKCSWAYNFYDYWDHDTWLSSTWDVTAEIGIPIDTEPNLYRRPALGALVRATYGMAVWANPQIVPPDPGWAGINVVWLNEVPSVAVCESIVPD